MKKILIFLGTITLIGTSTNSLIACNTPQEYTPEELKKLKEENQINTTNQEVRDNLEGIATQEKPFNQVDNKYYYVVWRGDEKLDGRIVKFKNDTLDFIKLDNFKKAELGKSSPYKFGSEYTLHIVGTFKEIYGEKDNGAYFKYVYRGNLDINVPDLDIDDKGNIKIKSE